MFLLATLLLHCKINFGQTPDEDRDNDYIINRRILSVENGLPGNSVICAVQDNDGFMWFGTDKGLSRYDGKTFTSYTKEKGGLAGNTVTQLYLDQFNRLVVVSDNITSNIDIRQVTLMDLKTYTLNAARSVSDYADLKPSVNWSNKLTGDIKYLDNSLYLNRKNKRVEIYSKQELANLPTLVFSGNYLDQYGNNWLCSNAGVFKIRYKQNPFHNYFNNQPTKSSNKQVRNIYTQADFKNENGMSGDEIYACMGNKLVIQKRNSVKTVVSKDFIIYSLLKTSEKFYVGGSKLLTLDLQSQAFRVETKIDDKEIWAMHQAAPHSIYVGTTNGVFLYNDLTNKCERLMPSNSGFPLTSVVYRFVQTSKHGLFAVAQNGLFKLNDHSIVDYYGPDAPGADHRLPISEIYDMYEDKAGICWISSNGTGLFRWNWSAPHISGALEHISLQPGIASNIICRIEEDNNSNLWISTYNGLFSFNKQNRLLYSFRTADGIINNEFNRMSSFKGPDGRMYFGTINGLTAFYPAEVLKQAIINTVPLQVTMINKFSAEKSDFEPCFNEYRSNKRIVINPGEGMLSVEFSLLDFEERQHVYKYIIEGLPGRWKIGEGNTININSLPYGEFKLIIKARLANGQWNPVEIEIPIDVIKPFYLKPWFITLCIVVLAAIIGWYFNLKTNKLLRNKSTLESLVQSRTNSLSKALHEKDLLIKEVHHRVKNNLQVIISLLHLQNEKITDENLKLSILESQARIGSIALIHQNLYQNDQLDGIRLDQFVITLGKQFDDFYNKLNRQIILETNIVDTCIDIDTAVPIGLILNELFSNTYKHAFRNSTCIKVTISLHVLSKGEYSLVYCDSGPGLSRELNFTNAKTLGLELIRGLARQLHGQANYRFREGGEFTVSFKDSLTRKNAS